MGKNFGKELVTRETKKSTPVLLRLGGVVLLLLLTAGGLLFILYPENLEDTIMGIVSLASGVILFVMLFVFSFKLRAKVVIYEEGVAVDKSGNEQRFHFSEITGLRDYAERGQRIFVPTGLGLAGAVVVGAAQVIAGNALDANKRKHRIRSIAIVLPHDIGKRGIPVANTGGDELSQFYTDWLIKTKAITKDNINSVNLSFGEQLELNNGAFIHTKRSGDTFMLALADVTDITAHEDSVTLYGLNDKDKKRGLISIKYQSLLNLDLLFYVVGLKKK